MELWTLVLMDESMFWTLLLSIVGCCQGVRSFETGGWFFVVTVSFDLLMQLSQMYN